MRSTRVARRGQTMAEVVILIGTVGLLFMAITLLFPRAYQSLYQNARNSLASPF